MNTARITGAILAAGYSSRMGMFKPLLQIGEKTLVARAVSLFRSGGIDDIRVVVGHCRERVEPLLEKAGVPKIVNTGDCLDMFSSVRLAMEAVPPTIDALILLPVDIPLVRPWTVRRLIDQCADNPDKILVPVFQGQKGHPVVIPARYFDKIIHWRGENGLRGALKAFAEKTILVPVPDANILFDMDTPSDYESALTRWSRRQIPTRAECESILKDIMGVSAYVEAHCRAVADVAGRIADALAGAGCPVDRERVVAAGLLHDMAKGYPQHDRAAAEMLSDMGFGAVAHLVARHTDICCSPDAPPNDAEILYLADKCVQGADVVDPYHRFCVAMERYGHDAEARPKIEKRLADAQAIQNKIECITGPLRYSVI